MIYLKVKEPEIIARKEKRIERIIRSTLGAIIPKANPDFDNKIPSVAYWLLEFSDKNSIPDREIGLGINEDVILKMPYKDNYGFWTDNNLSFEDFQKTFETVEITKEYFEEKWKGI